MLNDILLSRILSFVIYYQMKSGIYLWEGKKVLHNMGKLYSSVVFLGFLIFLRMYIKSILNIYLFKIKIEKKS